MRTDLCSLWLLLLGSLFAGIAGASDVVIEPGVNSKKSETFSVSFSNAQIGISSSLSGNSGIWSEEREKCDLLLDVGGENPSGVFDDAVSETQLSVTLSESREVSSTSTSWKAALENFATETGQTFDPPQEAADWIPIVLEINLEPTFLDEQKQIPAAVTRYARNKWEFVLEDLAEKNLQTFQEEGIASITTKDQSIICMLLFHNKLSVDMTVIARAPDRIEFTQILDAKCLSSMTRNAAVAIDERYGNFEWAKIDPKTFGFLVGSLFAQSEEKGFFGGSTKQSSPPCIVESEDPESLRHAVQLWTDIVQQWSEWLYQRPSMLTSEEAIKSLSAENSLSSRHITKVRYQHQFVENIEGYQK